MPPLDSCTQQLIGLSSRQLTKLDRVKVRAKAAVRVGVAADQLPVLAGALWAMAGCHCTRAAAATATPETEDSSSNSTVSGMPTHLSCVPSQCNCICCLLWHANTLC